MTNGVDEHRLRAGGGDTVCPGHRDVHEDDISAVRHGQLDCLGAILGQSDHLDVVAGLHQHRQPLPHDGVIIGDDDLDHDPSTSNVTVVPEPSTESMRNSPDTDEARSRNRATPR